MRTILISALAACAVLLVSGCPTTEENGIPAGACFPTGPDGDDFTEADAWCKETWCPQTPACEGQVVVDATCSRNASGPYRDCSCVCCEPQLNVGGTASEPEVWEEVYTCLLESIPPCEQDSRVKLELVQSGNCGVNIDWTITEGIGRGNQYTGFMDGGSFNWTSVPGTGTPEESGCWQFSEDAQEFNKLSGGAGFDCIGHGTRGNRSDPGTTATCAEIEAAAIEDFTMCPPAPPSSPID